MNRLSILLFAVCMLSFPGPGQAASPETPQYTKAFDLYTAFEVVWVREQAKVARDTYQTFYDDWGKLAFANIAESEQRHMDAMTTMVELYVWEDFQDVFELAFNDERGVFGDERSTALFNELIDRGGTSLFEAYRAAAYLEEVAIDELRGAAVPGIDEPQQLVDTYTNLLAGTYNHLRAFVAHIEALGFDYQAQVLTQAEVDEIVGQAIPPVDEDFVINAGLTDTWFNPATDGQGFFISVFPAEQKILLAWFTYDTELPGDDVMANLGDPGQRWLTAQGSYAGNLVELQVYSSSGGLFDQNPPVPVHEPMGSILLQFYDCNSGSVTYEMPDIGRDGVIPIQRVAPDNVTLCEQLGQPSD
jgi:hypothetical protein